MQIYEDAEAKYAALAKSITTVIEEAHAVLYAGSQSIDVVEDREQGFFFAANNIPDYARREVIGVSVTDHPSVKSHAAQLSRDRRMAYLLVEAGRGSEESVARPKGLYAEDGNVKSEHE